MSINFKVGCLTRLGIKPESAASESNALTTLPSELLMLRVLLYSAGHAQTSQVEIHDVEASTRTERGKLFPRLPEQNSFEFRRQITELL